MHRVEEVVVDAAVDDIDPFLTVGRAHPHLSPADDEVAALDELDAHHPCEEGVLEVGAVVDAGGEDDDGRLRGPLRRRRPQGLEEPPGVVVHRTDAHRREGLGEDIGHRAAVGDDVRDPGRDPDIVLEDPEGPLLVPDEVDAADVRAHTVRRAESGDGAVVVARGRDELPRDDAVLDGPRQPMRPGVDVVEEGLEHLDPLGHALLHRLPGVRVDDPRDGIEGEGALLPGVVEGHALLEEHPRERVGPLLESLGVHGPQGVVDRLVGRAGVSPFVQHLVPGRTTCVGPEELVAVCHGAHTNRGIPPCGGSVALVLRLGVEGLVDDES